jgi:hypothetical protein
VAFTQNRAGKLYCSPKCRQSAYYHKGKIVELKNWNVPGINNEILNFSLKEYKKYLFYRDKINNYRKLQSHFKPCEKGSDEWNFLYNNPCCALTWERKKLPKNIIDLNPPHFSIDQWSFVKSFNPELNPVDLIEFVCLLSSDFINEIISIHEDTLRKQNDKYHPIRNKYLHHLNKIVNGQIKFI